MTSYTHKCYTTGLTTRERIHTLSPDTSQVCRSFYLGLEKIRDLKNEALASYQSPKPSSSEATRVSLSRLHSTGKRNHLECRWKGIRVQLRLLSLRSIRIICKSKNCFNLNESQWQLCKLKTSLNFSYLQSRNSPGIDLHKFSWQANMRTESYHLTFQYHPIK